MLIDSMSDLLMPEHASKFYLNDPICINKKEFFGSIQAKVPRREAALFNILKKIHWIISVKLSEVGFLFYTPYH